MWIEGASRFTCEPSYLWALKLKSDLLLTYWSAFLSGFVVSFIVRVVNCAETKNNSDFIYNHSPNHAMNYLIHWRLANWPYQNVFHETAKDVFACHIAAIAVMSVSMLLPVLLLLPALSGSTDATCVAITDAQCDLLLSVSVSFTPASHAVLVEIDDAFRLQLRGFLPHDSPCWTREGRLKLNIGEDNPRCLSLRVGVSYIICAQLVEDECPRVVPGVRPAPLPRNRLRRQSSGENCLLLCPFYTNSVVCASHESS